MEQSQDLLPIEYSIVPELEQANILTAWTLRRILLTTPITRNHNAILAILRVWLTKFENEETEDRARIQEVIDKIEAEKLAAAEAEAVAKPAGEEDHHTPDGQVGGIGEF